MKHRRDNESSPQGIATAVDELTRDRSAMSLEAANREVYVLLPRLLSGQVELAGDYPG